MSSPFEQLIEQLEQISLAEHLEDPERLVAMLRERQNIVTALQGIDGRTLADELRASLKERLRAVLERDRALIERLRELQAETQRALEQAASGRAAARGYGVTAGANAPASSVKRVG